MSLDKDIFADVRAYGGPRDGAALSYKELAFGIARGDFDGYKVEERQTAGTMEEYLILRWYGDALLAAEVPPDA